MTPPKSPADVIVFALDVPDLESAKPLVGKLSGHVGLFKVGFELYLRAGAAVIDWIRSSGPSGVFLDLKLYDIPVTVSRAMAQIAGMGVDFATVHCAESPRMLEAAARAAAGRTRVLGVTLLTSLTGEDLASAGYREPYVKDPSLLVLERAETAKAAGCAGVVCPGREVSRVKAAQGEDFIVVTPGVRPAGALKAGEDQRRVATPAEAVRRGADYLGVGRPSRDAEDPVAAAEAIAREIEAALPSRLHPSAPPSDQPTPPR